jgi:CBS domain containing-hemolysin-like protein
MSLFLPLFFLFVSSIFSALYAALFRLNRFKSKEFFRSEGGKLFFYRRLIHRFFPRNEWENLFYCLGLSRHIALLVYAATAFLFLAPSVHDLGLLLAIIGVSLLSDALFRLLGSLLPNATLRLLSLPASLLLTPLFPLHALFLQGSRLVGSVQLEEEPLLDRGQIREILRESELQAHLDAFDQKLISSFAAFKEHVAKEIMVPRVDLFSLPASLSIQEAAPLFVQEGYSRIPIFRENLDEIVGVVLYKDLLKTYIAEADLEAPLETLSKPVLYAPENKKIASLLQEFRGKQIHMAIIVDEYGGTEGIVTIEDILEELVGEIEDEYDIGEGKLAWPLPGGGWVVDAKMSVLDIEEQLGLALPQSPEYETIGGYVFTLAGTIPAKGWRLLHDDFEIEVLSSNERSLKKLKVTPRFKPSC